MSESSGCRARLQQQENITADPGFEEDLLQFARGKAVRAQEPA